MKKPIIVLVMLVLGSQLPFCPYNLLPTEWVSSMEYGKKWTGILLQAYGLVATPEPERKSVDVPCPEEVAQGVVNVAVNLSMPEVELMVDPAVDQIKMKINRDMHHNLEMTLGEAKLHFNREQFAKQFRAAAQKELCKYRKAQMMKQRIILLRKQHV